jgi:hypothetical protein
MRDFEKHTLTDALRAIGNDAADMVLDAVACTLHNDGGTLGGNTEGSDVDWLALIIWQDESHEVPGLWNTLADGTKKHYRMRAMQFLRVMPRIAERIGNRMMTTAKAIRMIEIALYRQERKDRG